MKRRNLNQRKRLWLSKYTKADNEQSRKILNVFERYKIDVDEICLIYVDSEGKVIKIKVPENSPIDWDIANKMTPNKNGFFQEAHKYIRSLKDNDYGIIYSSSDMMLFHAMYSDDLVDKLSINYQSSKEILEFKALYNYNHFYYIPHLDFSKFTSFRIFPSRDIVNHKIDSEFCSIIYNRVYATEENREYNDFEFGKAYKVFLKRHQITQINIAEFIKLSKSTISNQLGKNGVKKCDRGNYIKALENAYKDMFLKDIDTSELRKML